MIREGWAPPEHAFKCPLCGSPYFRTEDNTSPDATGHCKGVWTGQGNYRGCTFQWKRNEDAKVFRAPEKSR